MRMGQGVRTGFGHGDITCVLQTQFSVFFFCCFFLFFFFVFLIPNAELLLDFAEMRVFCHMTKKIRMCDQSLEILLHLRTYLLDCFSSGSCRWILLKRILRFLSEIIPQFNQFGSLVFVNKAKFSGSFTGSVLS